MVLPTNLGFPRIGPDRELKKAVEAFWAGKSSSDELLATARQLRQDNWRMQQTLGLTHIPSNDFSMYDQVLDTIALVGAVPPRYDWAGGTVGLETYFAMARGNADVKAMAMMKWFDTNYHYIVPEFTADQKFTFASTKVIDEFKEAREAGIETRPVLVGPVTFLMLGKMKDEQGSPLDLLDRLMPVYEQVLGQLADLGANWVQCDEPALVLDLDNQTRAAFETAYTRLSKAAPSVSLMLATYFGGLRDNLATALQLPVAALHVDLVREPQQLDEVLDKLPAKMALSVGVVDGRNIWANDLGKSIKTVQHAVERLGTSRVQVGSSCSLLHSPVDLELETELDAEMKSWMAFAKQKLREIATIARAVNEGEEAVADELAANRQALESRRKSPRIHRPEVKKRIEGINEDMLHRAHSFTERRRAQQQKLNLPILPTTTIGSLPQTKEVRSKRAGFRAGKITQEAYDQFLRTETEKAIRMQEDMGIDMLVHGEFERNDMVQYFGEQLEGYVATRNGWVQSYGSRCVKPPVIFGDICRRGPMTVEWSKFAQSLTDKPVKGMTTGPVTILQWSFVRDDQPRRDTCCQIALAMRDEVVDLEAAGLPAIQIDEPALREGMPLRRADRADYMRWAVDCFRIASSGVRDETQIHTHMCYSEFNEIIDMIAELDADVISIEASRSDMQLLHAFVRSSYPNEIGPGVYDIHSPRVPSAEEMEDLLAEATAVLSPQQVWVNPDCGLKTRGWDEVQRSLKNMVTAAKNMRAKVDQNLSETPA